MKKIGLVLVVVLLSSLSAFGAVFTINNTGLGTAGNADSFWSITSPSAASAWIVTGSTGSYPFPAPGPWLADNSTSKWIAPQATYVNTAPGTKDAMGLWVFTTTFDLTGLNPATAAIAGRWLADDQGANITLNGHAFGLTTGLGQFTSWTTFNIGAGWFVAGSNTLSFTVNNAFPVGQANPDGLRVEFTSATADTVVPEPATFGLIGLGLLGLAAIRRHSRKSL